METTGGDFKARNIVFAAPQKELNGVYPLPAPAKQQPVCVFSVKGKRKEKYQNKKFIIFKPKNDIYLMLKEEDVDILYSSKTKVNLKKYYEKGYKAERFCWPVAIISSKKLIKQDLEKNVHVASDYNLPGLEASFLTGVYAANQIIKKNE